MNDLTYIKNILEEPSVQTLCFDVLKDMPTQKNVIKEIYRIGFNNKPNIEGADQEFAQRCCEIQSEYQTQLKAYEEEPDRWLQEQLECAENPVYLLCALSTLITYLHAVPWQRDTLSLFINQRIESSQEVSESDLQLLQQCKSINLTGLFSMGGYILKPANESRLQPGVPENMLSHSARILSISSYVAAKCCAIEGLPPDLSFDAICFLCNAMVDILWRKNQSKQSVAIVGVVLAIQYMHVNWYWEVLKRCALSIPELVMNVIGSLMKPILEMVQHVCSGTWEICKIRQFQREDLSKWVVQWDIRCTKSSETQRVTIKSTPQKEYEKIKSPTKHKK